jgi:hypothetical protein
LSDLLEASKIVLPASAANVELPDRFSARPMLEDTGEGGGSGESRPERVERGEGEDGVGRLSGAFLAPSAFFVTIFVVFLLGLALLVVVTDLPLFRLFPGGVLVGVVDTTVTSDGEAGAGIGDSELRDSTAEQQL